MSYAYIGVYGWTQSPLIEWYIVDSWGSQGRPTWCGTLVKTVTIDGAEYDIYKDDITQARGTIEGTKTFTQYWSIRKTARKCGTINITAHFNAWESAGLKMGSSLYEAKILGEAGQYPEEHNANGSFDFNYARVYVGEGSTTPTSSGSSNPGSSTSTRTSTGALPGTMEFENYESKQSDSLKVYGDVIGNIQPGDWVEWTVDVSYTGTYTFDILAAREDSQNRKSEISLSIDDMPVGSASVLTEGWDSYDTFSGVTSSISAGQHTFRVTFTDGYVNVDNIKFAENEVDKGSKYEPPPEAIAKARFALKGKDLQVFDMQGRHLGRVSVAAGTSLQAALSAKFHKPGIYLVKQGTLFVQVRVNH